MNRRSFLDTTSKLTLAAGLSPKTILRQEPNRYKSANEKIVLGMIGCNGMGAADMNNALKQANIECAMIADIDTAVRNRYSAVVTKTQGKSPVLLNDFRKLLDNKDIDAVVIGTPDHWHCLAMIYACQAGKDVYVEKPMANSIGECTAMVKAARKYNRVVQVGQQQRSGTHFHSAMDLIKSGGIGQLRKVNIWGYFPYGLGQKKVPDTAIPEGVDFDMWLGPAPKRSFNKTRFHGSWRMFWDYGGGLITDWGVHLLDMALWAKDITTPPKAVVSTGGNFFMSDTNHETFDTMNVSYQMDDYTIQWDHVAGPQKGPYGRNYGLAFVGNDATLVIDRDSWELFPEEQNGAYKVPAIPKKYESEHPHELHMQNFLECIKSRKDPNCTVENGRLVAMYAHMGNIALRTSSRLEWSEASHSFGNNKAANGLITPAYRKPWSIPGL
ncbi:MAG: Gfo/Idh/MocA family oxidoreductase [Saprospiraceae bacterium]